MSQPLVTLDLDDGTLFGNDAGEDEPVEILTSYFVDQDAFRPFLKVENRYAVARSKKGMGKSALLSKFAYDLRERGDPEDIIVRIIGSQIIAEGVPEFASFLDAQAFWVRSICSRINAALGAKIGFAFSDTQMSLVEAAELASLLYQAGFLVARFGDKDKSDNVEFVTYSQRPELLRYGNPIQADLLLEI